MSPLWEALNTQPAGVPHQISGQPGAARYEPTRAGPWKMVDFTEIPFGRYEAMMRLARTLLDDSTPSQILIVTSPIRRYRMTFDD